MLRPFHRWIWRDTARRAHKLLRFAETEADGGRDLVRAAEVTRDSLLRRLYLVHAADELHHADLFRRRGADLLQSLPVNAKASAPYTPWTAPIDHGIDDLRVENEPDEALLAFLHLAEKSAAGSFAVLRDVVSQDPSTRAVFDEILRDEAFHMNYTHTQLQRVSPHYHRRRLWRARATRLWKGYMRVAAAMAGMIGTLILIIEYFTLLAPFAWLAKRSARREHAGWTPIPPSRTDALTRQY